MAFADLYPFDTFASIADAAWWRSNDFTRKVEADQMSAANTARALDARDRQRVEEHKEVFTQALSQHLEALRDAGRLGAAVGIKGRDLPQVTAWNDLVAGEAGDYTRNWLLNGLQNVWTRAFVRMDSDRFSRRQSTDYVLGQHVLPSAKQQRAAWDYICNSLDHGNSDDEMMGWAIRMTDANTGDNCELQFENWTAKLMVRNADYELVPAKDVQEIALVTAEFDMPTGKLMLTDVLRVEGFKEATEFDSDRDYGELSLNTAAGCTARISAHAEEHQVGYTQTTNTFVAVYQSTDKASVMVIEAYLDDEWPMDDNGNPVIDGWHYIGSFSCDVWRIMAFDRATAQDLMAKGGCAAPEAELNRYLAMATAEVAGDDRQAHHEKSYAGNIVHLDVTPGRWSIHAGADFASRVDFAAYNIPQGVEPWCILSRAA